MPYAPVSSGPSTVEPWPTSPAMLNRGAGREVFDTVVDSRNEPSSNPAMAGVELLTRCLSGRDAVPCTHGQGGHRDAGGVDRVDRLHRLGSRTTSSMMETSGALTFAAEGEGTVMGWDWQVHPKGWMRMLGPLFGPPAAAWSAESGPSQDELENNGTACPPDPVSTATDDRGPRPGMK